MSILLRTCCILFLGGFTLAVRAAVVLQYHHVATDTPPSTSTSPAQFRMHLDYLAAEGFDVVPLQDLVDTLRRGEPLPDKTVAITFDDGYRSIYDTAWPLLKARNWPFTVFINTEPHDRGNPLFMSWDQLRALHAGGATIANHTVSHPHLLPRTPGVYDAAWEAWLRREITAAQQRIEAEIGHAGMLFAYPYGEFDRAVRDVVNALGYAAFGQHSGPLAGYSQRTALPRFPFGGPYGDRQDFATKVGSRPMPLAAGDDVIRWLGEDGRTLSDIVLDGPEARPVLALRLADDFDASRMACFASGQGRISLVLDAPWVYAQATAPLATGRARYNCTAPSDEPGRYYWFSQPWLIR
ncbi:MAG: polysaccharide deacetylase family protein [Xanthomonadales bacterium]